MNTGSVKNIVVLKDLPSNLVEEAIVFLKENQKLKKPELIDVDIKQKNSKGTENRGKANEENTKDYIVNEAQMLISEYISRLENGNKKEAVSYKKLKKKYELLKKVSGCLTVALVASVLLLFII